MKLTKKQKEILEKLKSGAVIQFLPGDETDIYTLTNGERVNRRTIDNLLHKGAIKPNSDGLFPGFHQSYSAAI